jgi:XTP/dITP diphosphohydrolase
VLASDNAGTRAGVAAVLAPWGIEVVPVAQVAPGWTIAETGDTFAANAALKAHDLARRTGVPALGDDSGLEVAALDGRPGVRSARYAGEGADDATNVALLLRELAAVPAAGRAAAFRCVMVLAWPDGVALRAEGACAGEIAHAPRGTGGFGYDPVFVDPTTGRTFAELSAVDKNARSHRRRALERLRAGLEAGGPGGTPGQDGAA